MRKPSQVHIRQLRTQTSMETKPVRSNSLLGVHLVVSYVFAGRTDTSVDYVYVLIIRPDTYEKLFERKIVIIFLPINFNICFGSSKEPSKYVLVEK